MLVAICHKHQIFVFIKLTSLVSHTHSFCHMNRVWVAFTYSIIIVVPNHQAADQYRAMDHLAPGHIENTKITKKKIFYFVVYRIMGHG